MNKVIYSWTDMMNIIICDPLCENPAKVIFCDLLIST